MPQKMQPDEVAATLLAAGQERYYEDPVIEANAQEYEELYDLALFVLIVGVPYETARNMRDIERRAFLDAHAFIQKEQQKAAKRR